MHRSGSEKNHAEDSGRAVLARRTLRRGRRQVQRAVADQLVVGERDCRDYTKRLVSPLPTMQNFDNAIRLTRGFHFFCSTGLVEVLTGDDRLSGLNSEVLVEMKDNLIGEESRYSPSDYNCSKMLRFSDNSITRASVLQAIEELATYMVTTTQS
jgi:hypothetical protein